MATKADLDAAVKTITDKITAYKTSVDQQIAGLEAQITSGTGGISAADADGLLAELTQLAAQVPDAAPLAA